MRIESGMDAIDGDRYSEVATVTVRCSARKTS